MSSVVGASAAFGKQALDVGATVKLTRTLWITPAVLAVAWLRGSKKRIQAPLFIIGFIAAATLRSPSPRFLPAWNALAAVAGQSLVATLFLVGSGLIIFVGLR